MTTGLPESYLRYLATREAERADAINAVLAGMTERERRLVKEAAVMGYVQGRRHLQGEDHPKDSVVLATVIDACLSNDDLYPTISADPPAEAQPPRHRWYVETLDDVAGQGAPGMRYADRDQALERYRLVSEQYPTWRDGTPIKRRFVRETTTHTVEDVPDLEQDRASE